MKRFLFFASLMLSVIASAGEPDFFFIQLSDVQIGFFDSNKTLSRDSLNFEEAVRQINRLHPAFVINTGDMLNAGTSSRQQAVYDQILSKIDKDIPVWHVPGNHDLGKGATDSRIEKFVSHYGCQRFSFRYNDCAFIGINSCVIKDENKPAEEEQYKWLEKELKKSSKKCKAIYVFSHYPVFIKAFDEKVTYSNLVPADRERYWNLFRRYGVSAVVAGHLHDTKKAEYEGIGMYTSGPVGRPLGHGCSGVAVWTIKGGTGYHCDYVPLEKLGEYKTNN